MNTQARARGPLGKSQPREDLEASEVHSGATGKDRHKQAELPP